MTMAMMMLQPAEGKAGFGPTTERIGIFGGAFDPVHDGHISIALSFLKSNIIHRLLILPTPDPPHKKKEELASFQHRLRMLELAFNHIENTTVSDLESRLPSPSYSLQTLNYLLKELPATTCYICIGEDSLTDFKSWYHYEEILEKCCLLVAERPGYDKSIVQDDILERTIFVEHEPVPVSSTEIRSSASGSDVLQLSLPDQVREYISGNNLYSN